MKRFYFITILGIIVDRLLKVIATSYLTTEHFYVINNFFYLTYAKNEGAAFSLLEGHQIVFVLMAFLAVFIIYLCNKKSNSNNIGYPLLLGGVIGNLIDRLAYNHVIDFIGFKLFGKMMPIFNFADILIVVGAVIVLIGSDKNENKGK